MAVWRVIFSVASKLANTRVRWFTDNQNVARILQVGSRKPQLHAIALKVFALSVHFQIRLELEWIPRELNERADYLSRIIDYDDWLIKPVSVCTVRCRMGPKLSIVLLAFIIANYPASNRCWNAGSEAVNTFTVNWAGKNNW